MTASPQPPPNTGPTGSGSSPGLLLISWLIVGLPLAWGVWQTIQKSLALFQ